MNSNTLFSKSFSLTVVASALLMLSSCAGKLGKLTSDNFTVNPLPLETQVGQVPATINANFPEKFMNKKAVVTITPELRGSDGTIERGTPVTFQGEKVMGNDQTISYLLGGKATMRSSFNYSDALHKSNLYLTFDAKIGNKAVKVPELKVGNGVLATSELYRACMQQTGGCIAPDTFQRVRTEKQEANIKFLINQAQLRQSELKSNSVQEFVKLLRTINDEKESYVLQNIEVKAYASPDGGEKINEKVASERLQTSEKYAKQELKNAKLTGNVASEYTAQDWEGFQKLVAASNIQDKDVILRVLSMYSDPEEREQQIKNMSQGFRELADGILPELRRSRLIVNYETVGRSDDQIKDQFKSDPTKLSADELLYAATLTGMTSAEKEQIYNAAAQQYPDDYRAYNNLAVLAMQNGNDAAAKDYIQKALAINPKAGDPQANLAMIALKNGDTQTAQNCLSQATNATEYNKAMGMLNLAKGNYAAAEVNFNGQYNNMAALAQIMNKDYSAAQLTFKNIDKNGDAMTDYLHAINNARLQNSYASNAYLKDAIKKDPSLQKYADEDMEFDVFKKK